MHRLPPHPPAPPPLSLRTGHLRLVRAVETPPMPAGPPPSALSGGLAGVVHEMRNFLAPVPHAIELLRHPLAAGETERVVALLQQQFEGLDRLVLDLLDVSRIESGKLQLRLEGCSLADVARSTIAMCAPAAQARSQALVLEAAGPATVLADPVRLMQALSNLVFNAVRHAPEGSAIRIAVDAEGADALLSVRDEGCGMAPELCARVFELGAQHRSGGGSLGIGLFLVRAIAQLHGGSASAWSAGPGQGSTFTIRLPMARTSSPAADET